MGASWDLMMLTPMWLQELRELVAIRSDDKRRHAMRDWERRWLVELHAMQCISERELSDGPQELMRAVHQQMKGELGQSLCDHMAATTVVPRMDWSTLAMIYEIRADAMAIRWEPKLRE